MTSGTGRGGHRKGTRGLGWGRENSGAGCRRRCRFEWRKLSLNGGNVDLYVRHSRESNRHAQAPRSVFPRDGLPRG